MSLSTFEYNLALLSLILIVTIIVIILYKKYEDDEDEANDVNNKININDTYISRTINSNMYENKDTYLKINMNTEHFYNPTDLDLNIDSIFSKNSNISTLISSINRMNESDPSLNLKYKTEKIDQDLQSNISASLYSNTNDLISRVNTSNIRINDKITTLTDQITDLENIIERLHLKSVIKQKYTKIKSLNNGVELILTQTPNTFFVDPGTGVNTAAYMVNLNNGCLSVGSTDYDVYKCNDNNPKHLFKMEHIINETAYKQTIDKAVPVDNVDVSTINYPFVLMRSVNNKNCLTNQNGIITVQPCSTLIAQRWLPL